MKRYFIIISILAFNLVSVSGQISVSLGGYGRSELNVTSEVPVSIGTPSKEGFSTKQLSENFPASNIPVETISIAYPRMSDALDTVAILWYLKPENYSPRGEVNIVLVTINSDSIKTFYIDNNNDRIFADNELRFNFKPEEQSKGVEIKIIGNYYRYTLMNPDYVAPVAAPSRIGEYSAEWRKSVRRPSVNLDFSLMTGGGKASVSFVPSLVDIDMYSYNANLVGSIKPTVALDISWYGFHVAGFVAFERLQYDETVLYAYSPRLNKGRQRFYDRGTWPSSKVHYGVSAEYDIRIFKVYLSPVATYSIYKNLNEVDFDRSIDAAPDAEYSDMHTKEFGGKFKIPIGFRSMVYIKYLYSTSWFDVSDFIVPYEEGTYDVDYNQNYFGVGLLFRLTK